MSKKKVKKSKKKKAPDIHLGYREFVCKSCQSHFTVDWEAIFAIQETTHGYVGYEYGDYYIECPRCGHEVKENGDWGDIPDLF